MGAHLHGAEDGDVDAAAADHAEGLGRVEVVVDIFASRLARAERLGTDMTLVASSSLAEDIAEALGGARPDVVIVVGVEFVEAPVGLAELGNSLDRLAAGHVEGKVLIDPAA